VGREVLLHLLVDGDPRAVRGGGGTRFRGCGGDDDERNGDRDCGDADAGEQGTDVHGDLLGGDDDADDDAGTL
jgi:hypothetical protein